MAAAGSQRSPFSSPVCVRLEEGGRFTLGEEKTDVGLITRERWLRGSEGEVLGGFPGTAARATGDLAPRVLSPGLCRAPVKESYHPPAVLPSKSSALLLGYKRG